MAENYVLLETIQLTQTASSVVFDNIPQTGYTDLKIVICALGGSTEGMYIRFNNSTTGFAGRYLIGDGNSPASGVLERYIGSIMNQTVTPNNVDVYIPNYTSSNSKSFSVDSSQENAATTGYGNIIAGLWSNSAAINSITLEAANSFRTNSSFSLYGVAALNTTPTIAPLATGGNIVANDGTYWYHAFLSSGYFAPQKSLTCDVLAVGGAGGGGGLGSGGGGGGVIPSQSLSFVSANNYAIGVGGGGTGVSASDLSTNGGRGTDTTVMHSTGTTTAFGGGGGLAYSPAADSTSKNGGSGGGGGGGANNYGPGTGVAGQGNAGGNTLHGGDIRGGGGGGYSAAGGNAVSNAGGNGGQGYNLPSAIQTLLNGTTHVGSGGGGGCRGSVGSAGVGGTGAASGTNNATNAPNPTMLGCGGGAPGQSAPSGPFGSASPGYSGVVVIRYAMAS
jgi:hypothetical protein